MFKKCLQTLPAILFAATVTQLAAMELEPIIIRAPQETVAEEPNIICAPEEACITPTLVLSSSPIICAQRSNSSSTEELEIDEQNLPAMLKQDLVKLLKQLEELCTDENKPVTLPINITAIIVFLKGLAASRYSEITYQVLANFDERGSFVNALIASDLPEDVLIIVCDMCKEIFTDFLEIKNHHNKMPYNVACKKGYRALAFLLLPASKKYKPTPVCPPTTATHTGQTSALKPQLAYTPPKLPSFGE